MGIGIEVGRGQYCALWKAGACATETSMISIPPSAQTVSTFVLADYHYEEHVAMDGFAVAFLVACACAMLISLLLVGCICYRVISRVCCRRAEINCDKRWRCCGRVGASQSCPRHPSWSTC